MYSSKKKSLPPPEHERTRGRQRTTEVSVTVLYVHYEIPLIPNTTTSGPHHHQKNVQFGFSNP